MARLFAGTSTRRRHGIDLVAGGKSKRTKRTAPRSDDIYLKLIGKAELEIDEVYVQITLIPQHDQDENAVTKEPTPPAHSRFHVYSFCKTLTASDTSTHRGFSVLRRHADECLPPLDMSRQPPTQDPFSISPC